jgi:hypothetical protein
MGEFGFLNVKEFSLLLVGFKSTKEVAEVYLESD